MDFSVIKELETKIDLRGITRRNLCFEKGKDNHLIDTFKKEYLDLVAGHGENCLGYGHQGLLNAIKNQVDALLSASPKYYNLLYGETLNKLVMDTGFSHAALTSSGVESNLLALSILNNYLDEKSINRRKVIVVSAGNTTPEFMSSKSTINVNLTFQQIEMNDFSALKDALIKDTAAVIIQPISDIYATVADYDFLINAYALIKSMDIILISDETTCGVGRTGTRYAYQGYGIQPDIVTLGRGLGGGILCGAIMTRGIFKEYYMSQGNGLDEGGNSLLTCAAVNTVLDTLDESFLKEIEDKGAYLYSSLCKLSKHNFILNISSKGLSVTIELAGRISAARIAGQMEKAGFLIGFTDANIIKITPPFTITKTEIDETCQAMAAVFAGMNI